jgi:flagellar biogenesis protein FliO
VSELRSAAGKRSLRVAVASILLFPAGPAFAQRLGQGTGTEVPMWRILGALALCLLLALGAAFVLKRRLKGPNRLAFGRPRRLQLVESLRLSHQVDLCIVSCDQVEFVIASTPHGASLVNAGPLSGAAREGVQ